MAKANPKITLRCPTCKRSKRVDRQPNDPAAAVECELECDRCSVDFEMLTYFDANGDEVDVIDPTAPAATPTAGNGNIQGKHPHP